MKDRGKAVEDYFTTTDQYYYSSSSTDFPCKKHPSSSSVGICAYCLKDRLLKLVCSDCGEQRLSSCSCSEISSSYTNNSCSTVEVGSVGRVSFLIENERTEPPQQHNSNSNSNSNSKLKRSSSSHVEIKRKSINGFWKIGKFFRKKIREKGNFDEKSDLWVFDNMGVSRSRSLCSFRGGGGGLLWSEDGGSMSVSAARSSSVNGGLLFDSGKKSGFSETEVSRKSGFDGGIEKKVVDVFKLKEIDFNDDESGFIDLKLDLSSESKPEFPVSDLDSVLKSLRHNNKDDDDYDECGNGGIGGGASFRSLIGGDGIFSNGGSCRIPVNERGIKKSRKSLKVWRWIFRHSHFHHDPRQRQHQHQHQQHHHHHHHHQHQHQHQHHSNCRSESKKDEDHCVLKS